MKIIHNKFFDLGASIVCGTAASYLMTKVGREYGLFDSLSDLSKLGITFLSSFVGVGIAKFYIQHLKNEENNFNSYAKGHAKIIHNKFFDLGASIVCGTAASYLITKVGRESGLFDSMSDLSKLGITFLSSFIGIGIAKFYIQHLKDKDIEKNNYKPYIEEHTKEQNGVDSLDFFKVTPRKPR